MKKTRVLIGIFGLDQHEVGALSVAQMLRDAGMEVIYAGRFNTPSTLVRGAIQEDVDVIGISCHSWEYLHYTPELIELLKKEGADIALVVGGSVITPADARSLTGLGVSAVFGPGAAREDIIATIAELGSKRK
ncbi:MAG: cobalamin B12-binding domain-containing protein [Bacillota bacterium]